MKIPGLVFFLNHYAFSSAIFCQAWDHLFIPPSLKLGAGSSAAQIEGAWNVDGKSPSVIDTIFQNNADNSSKSYELWRTDVDLIKKLGLQMYRFSIPWTRILPTGRPDYINQKAVKRYSQLIDALLKINVEPIITILHFDLPQSLQDLGGWHNPTFPDWLADYSRVLFSIYGSRVKTWFTINEPLVECYIYDSVLFGNQTQPYLCTKNLLLGHAKAWWVYDEEFRDWQNGQIKIVINLTWMVAESEDDEPLAELLRQYFGGLYSHPVYSEEGGWPRDLQEALAGATAALPELTCEEIELMRGTYDFYAFNYYSAQAVRRARPNETVGPWPFAGTPELGAVLEDTSPKFKIYPEGIRAQMNWLNKQYGVTRFIVTENGLVNNRSLEDQEKIVYIQNHIQQVVLTIVEDGLDVFGYSMWSLLDSFEFDSAYELKFGLYRVNFSDPMRTRTPRDSAYYYRNLIANAKNGRPTKLVTENGSTTTDEEPDDVIDQDNKEGSYCRVRLPSDRFVTGIYVSVD